jgi:NAD(P)-dependent dehydrogenase (short-subunit alcohol dehydrogenase family)
MSSKSVALILGAGPRVGSAVASKFASSGYAVALASRKGSGAVNADGYLTIKADLTKTESIKEAFGAAKAQFGSAPSVVVYNAAALTPPPVEGSPLSIPAESFVSDLTLNTTSPYVAAQQALEGWATLPQDVTKAFIYTGNVLNVQILPVPLFLTLGVGKSASAYWIGTADAAYADKGYRWVLQASVRF